MKKEEKKKILYVTNYKPGKGGISGQVEYLVSHLSNTDNEGYKADVFSTKGNFLKRIVLLFLLLIRAKKYDILHVHACSGWGFLPVVYGVIAGKLIGRKIIVTYHGGDASYFFSKHPKTVRFWLMKADERVVLSGFLKSIFDEYSIPSKVIANIVELKDDVYVEKTCLRPRFISVRHLRDLYNIPCIIKAFEKVQKEVPEARLMILGDGDKRNELETYVMERGVKNIEFVGQVPNSDMGYYLQQNDILLSAPLIDNMPVSLLEAFSAGLLVISSNVGGVPYMVENKRTGILFPSDDHDALAEQMMWALSHEKECLQIILNAKKEVEKYSWNVVGKKIRALYE